ncbi:class I SAM-dependent methyltransferase [Nocardiopsis halophila]|uniref:class I SAM-dependent methyltransferase n=1 Tax=Nocardiopsis halophila TaxID=141692 RepID=UPI001F4C8D86|nr:class I SAM-dependent methyltransferase [Nocardiopsis halophila]
MSTLEQVTQDRADAAEGAAPEAERTEPRTDPEKVRLEWIASLTDPATFRYLEQIGVGQGWHCAEVGAGAGSVARWLSSRVGQFGTVLALDTETSHMEGLSAPNLEIRRQDITRTPLEKGAYDLVHAKILLMHLEERERVLGEFVAALKPGGYLLVEEADIRSIQRTDPPSPLLTRAASALETFFYFGGADPGYGMKLLPAVRRTGLKVLGTDCQLTAVQAGTPAVQTVSMSLAKLAPMIVKAGLMGQQEVDAAFELLEKPSDMVVYTPVTVSVWGRAEPGEGPRGGTGA